MVRALCKASFPLLVSLEKLTLNTNITFALNPAGCQSYYTDL